jgi:hypothetical protein
MIAMSRQSAFRSPEGAEWSLEEARMCLYDVQLKGGLVVCSHPECHIGLLVRERRYQRLEAPKDSVTP